MKRPMVVRWTRALISGSRSRGAHLVTSAVVALLAASAIPVGRAPDASAASWAELPRTPDYHSLVVTDARTLLLGTHDGLYRSTDAGRTWEQAGLAGRDAMHLVRQGSGAIWVAGHGVLARSRDGGETWADLRPDGLPGLDIHAFAVDPRDPRRVYAAIAGQGMYRSSDGGKRFTVASRDVGRAVMALGILPDGALLAGDLSRSVVALSKDGGRSWRGVLRAQINGLSVEPRGGRGVLASGPGVLLSVDGGLTWRQTLRIESGAGPIAWAAGAPRIAYVVGLDRSLYRSSDRGATWRRIVGGAS